MERKSNKFCGRDSLRDAIKNLGLKNSDIDMSNKRACVDMSVSDVMENPINMKKGGIVKMPIDKMHRLKRPTMSKGGMCSMSKSPKP